MKKHFYLLLLITKIGFSQISIDSFAVYNTGGILDSFYMKTTSQGQIFHSITLPSTLDICATVYGFVFYKGCETGVSTTIDSMFTYGYYCKKMFLNTYWDTSTICNLPLQVTLMDTAKWNQCDNWGINEESLQRSISVFPNPSKGEVHIQNSDELEILDIWLLDQLGRGIKQFGNHEEDFDLSEFERGIYFLKIKTIKSDVLKKVLLE